MDTLQVHTVASTFRNAQANSKSDGVLGYGADGPYGVSVNLFCLAWLAYQSVRPSAMPAAPPAISPRLRHALSAIPFVYKKHPKVQDRVVHVLRETAIQSQKLRGLDSFMIAHCMDLLLRGDDAKVRQAIKLFNASLPFFLKLQLQECTANRIIRLVNKSTTPLEHIKLMQAKVAYVGCESGPWSNAKLDIDGFYVTRPRSPTSTVSAAC